MATGSSTDAREGPPHRPRYVTLFKLASGGVADVFVGAARGAHGFRQLVAIKRPHPHRIDDPAFRASLLAEARLAARLHHANVVDVRDVEVDGASVQLVMDYVDGAALGSLIVRWSQGGAPIPPAVAVRIVLDAAAGLHAAHELEGDDGRPLGLVHRDVSPQNVLIGLDGVARVTDFGIAKVIESTEKPTTDGALKGKVGYMSPEYVRGQAIDRRADVFALGVVLWETLAGKRLFRGASDVETLERIAAGLAPRVSESAPPFGDRLDAVVARALERVPEARWPSARAFATALEDVARPDLVARPEEVAAYLRAALGDEITERRRNVSDALRSLENEPIAVESASATTAMTAAPRASRATTGWWLVVAALVVVGLAAGLHVIDLRGAARVAADVDAGVVPTAASLPAVTATSASSAPSAATVASATTTSASAAMSVSAPHAPPAPPNRPRPSKSSATSVTPRPPPNPY